jgi:hypothetical protein
MSVCNPGFSPPDTWITFVPQIRQILNLPEITPEELIQAREEHPWLFETQTEN